MKQIFFFHSILLFLIISLLTLFDPEKTGNSETISKNNERQSATTTPSSMVTPIIIFMCGDVMIGRGIDQVLPHPSDPLIHEPFMRSARGYVDIAEQINGPIPRPVSYSYIWGDALEEWERMATDVRIINLETSVTESDDYWQGKSIHYRMHPENIPTITTPRSLENIMPSIKLTSILLCLIICFSASGKELTLMYLSFTYGFVGTTLLIGDT